jgi:hypothetical protein
MIGRSESRISTVTALSPGPTAQVDSVSFDLVPDVLPFVASWLRIGFEDLNMRFANEDFIEERLRFIDAELPGKVRTLSRIEAIEGRPS